MDSPVTINEAQNKIIRDFAELDDWFDKYEYLIGLGKQHPSLDDQFKTDEYALDGCQSQVWIRHERNNGHLHFQADSDSVIIKGILSLLLQVLNDRPPADIAQADLQFLQEIGLINNLSPSRANGVATIVRHLQRCGATEEMHPPQSTTGHV
jgi:cysteine desulfuration protein SufE